MSECGLFKIKGLRVLRGTLGEFPVFLLPERPIIRRRALFNARNGFNVGDCIARVDKRLATPLIRKIAIRGRVTMYV